MTADNRELVRRATDEIWNRKRLDRMDHYYAPHCVFHDPLPGAPPTLPGLKHWTEALHSAFADLHVTTEQLIAEGDLVVQRWTARGTHTGEFLGALPTGHVCVVGGIDVMRIADGRIVETWGSMDELGMIQQLGLLPHPTAVF